MDWADVSPSGALRTKASPGHRGFSLGSQAVSFWVKHRWDQRVQSLLPADAKSATCSIQQWRANVFTWFTWPYSDFFLLLCVALDMNHGWRFKKWIGSPPIRIRPHAVVETNATWITNVHVHLSPKQTDHLFPVDVIIRHWQYSS